MEQPEDIKPLSPDPRFKYVVVGYKPAADDGVENGSTILFDGPTSRNFEALIPGGYTVPGNLVDNSRGNLQSKLMFGPGVQDIEAGRVIFEYLTGVTTDDRLRIKRAVMPDVSFDGIRWHDGHPQSILTTTVEGLLRVIASWNEILPTRDYVLDEASVTATKAMVRFRSAPIQRFLDPEDHKTWASMYDLKRDEQGDVRISKIYNVVPVHNGPRSLAYPVLDVDRDGRDILGRGLAWDELPGHL